MTDLLRLCLVCLRVGTFVFGGGMVMIPLLQADVVDRYGWLTQQEFVDAVALGQMTPGPLLVTATFVGFKVAGVGAAALATLCMFLPSCVMTIAASNRLARLQGNRWVVGFLSGVRAAVVALILVAVIPIAQGSITSVGQGALGLAALALLLLWKRADAGLVVIACGLVGLALWSA